MTESTGSRLPSDIAVLNMHARMDKQDEMLARINEKLTSHLAVQAEIKPSVDELVRMLNGLKFLRTVVLIIIPLSAGIWKCIEWFREHFRWA
jgi:hypothetical protein